MSAVERFAGPNPRQSNLPRPEVPVGASGEVARVLGAATHYEVLEVAQDAGVQTAQSHHATSRLLILLHGLVI